MTAMPQLVSLFNAVGGGAAALVAIDDTSVTGRPRRPVSTDGPAVLDVAIGRDLHRLAHRLRQADGPDQRQADHLPGRPILTAVLAIDAVAGTGFLVLFSGWVLSLDSQSAP